MKAYLVGGCVRDEQISQIHGKKIISNDRDWVVVGATIDDMLKNGFIQVGKNFPVFLHPKTKEEWALARRDIKKHQGYKGFSFEFSPHITLNEDLRRRDLTINAIAKDPITGDIIDPFNGIKDIRNKTLQHISTSFIEDPLRVLRVARFATKFHDFKISPRTLKKMQQIATMGELEYLVPERVWQEFEKVFQEKRTDIFFKILKKCNALQSIWPEFDMLWQQYNEYNSNKSIAEKNLELLKNIAYITPNIEIKFAILCHNISYELNKDFNIFQQKKLIAHNIYALSNTCSRFKIPNKTKTIANKISQYYQYIKNITLLKENIILQLLDKLKLFKKSKLHNQIIQTIIILLDYERKNKNYKKNIYFILNVIEKISDINIKSILKYTNEGTEIKKKINKKKLFIISNEIIKLK